MNLVFVGDFNCPQSHTVFNPLKKMGYNSVFENQKTSLKRECVGDNCLASEFDNIWYSTNKFKVLNSNVVPFYKLFDSLELARQVSDHIPVVVELGFR